MKSTLLFASLLQVATSNLDGFTVSSSNLQTITTGYAVAVKQTQNSFGPEGLKRVLNYARKDSRVSAFGGWLDSESGLFYWDAVIICTNRDEAETIARENGQRAFYDLNTCTEIRL